MRELDLIKVRQNRQELRELTGAIIAEQIVLPGREHDPDAPKPKTKKAKAEQAAAEAERTIAVGTELTEELAERLRELKYRKIKVFASYMTVDVRDELDAFERGERDEPHVLARDVVDPTSGEVIAEADQPLMATLVKKLRKHEVTKVQVFASSGRVESRRSSRTRWARTRRIPRRRRSSRSTRCCARATRPTRRRPGRRWTGCSSRRSAMTWVGSAGTRSTSGWASTGPPTRPS